MPASPVMVWFRDDLRLSDHAALTAAAARGAPLICLYVLDETSAAPLRRPFGGASRWWLAQSLRALQRDLVARGASLTLRRGAAPEVIAAVMHEAYGKQATKIGIHNFSIPVGVQPDGIKRAQDLIKWMSDNNAYWANSGQVPARLSAQKQDIVQNIWETKVAADEFSHIGLPDVGHKSYTEIQQTWEAAVSAALAKTQPVQAAMKQGDQQVQAILDRG